MCNVHLHVWCIIYCCVSIHTNIVIAACVYVLMYRYLQGCDGHDGLNIRLVILHTITFICIAITAITLHLTFSSHRGFSPGGSDVILDIDYCDSAYRYYYYDNTIYRLNFIDDCSIQTGLQCSHDSDAAVECVGEWTNKPGNDFCYHLPWHVF